MRLRIVGAFILVCGLAMAQQFRISDYAGDSLTIEYPPSFDGAYLFDEITGKEN